MIQNNKFGFGLLEVLIAVGLITILLGGAVVLGSVLLRSSVLNKHRLQATMLGQKSIEAIKQIRDTNWTKQNPSISWDEGLKNCNRGCYLVQQGNDWKLTNDSSFSKVKFNETEFDQIIKIYDIKDDESIVPNDYFKNMSVVKKVEIQTTWQDYGNTETINIQSIITDWKPL